MFVLWCVCPKSCRLCVQARCSVIIVCFIGVEDSTSHRCPPPCERVLCALCFRFSCSLLKIPIIYGGYCISKLLSVRMYDGCIGRAIVNLKRCVGRHLSLSFCVLWASFLCSSRREKRSHTYVLFFFKRVHRVKSTFLLSARRRYCCRCWSS